LPTAYVALANRWTHLDSITGQLLRAGGNHRG
jgi:hypothetical protein